MLKEIILAIIIGALLGFGLTGGYLALNKKNNNNPQPTPTQIVEEKKDEENNSVVEKINITSIQDYDIVENDDLEIAGESTPNSTVIITLADQIIDDTTNDKGQFTNQLSLDSGLNIIKITVIDPEDNQFEKTLHITYSTAKI